MINDTFAKQIKRLSDRWPNIYNTEISTMIWKQMRDIPDYDFEIMITEFLASVRLAPLLPDFCAKASEIRERIRQKQREKERQDSKDFWSGTYHPEEQKWMFDLIRNRIKELVPDSEWLPFIKLLEENAARSMKSGK